MRDSQRIALSTRIYIVSIYEIKESYHSLGFTAVENQKTIRKKVRKDREEEKRNKNT